MNVEVNLCHKSGCRDLCCRGRMWLRVKKTERIRTFPEAKQVLFDTEVRSLGFGEFVFAKNDDIDMELLLLNRDCTHLVTRGCDGSQTIACKAFQLGGEECNRIRKKHGLLTVDKQGNIMPERRNSLGTLVRALLGTR